MHLSDSKIPLGALQVKVSEKLHKAYLIHFTLTDVLVNDKPTKGETILMSNDVLSIENNLLIFREAVEKITVQPHMITNKNNIDVVTQRMKSAPNSQFRYILNRINSHEGLLQSHNIFNFERTVDIYSEMWTQSAIPFEDLHEGP